MHKHHVTDPVRRANGAILLVGLASLMGFSTRPSQVQASQVVSTSPDKPERIVKTAAAQPNSATKTGAPKEMPATTPGKRTAAPMATARASARKNPVATQASAETPDSKQPSESTTVVAPSTGTLAISSLTTVDIYKDDAYIGSVPVSLELPEGTYTLEYRHGTVRKNATHVVTKNETTKAMITFDANLRINAKPWAEVFVDGIEKMSLGQTPLSDVRVPIGTLLIFENPQFQPKKYRVTGNETAIQIMFQER